MTASPGAASHAVTAAPTRKPSDQGAVRPCGRRVDRWRRRREAGGRVSDREALGQQGDPRRGLLEPIDRQPPRLGRGDDRVHDGEMALLRRLRAHAEQVAARDEGPHGGLRDARLGRGAGHVEGVRHDDALVAEPTAQHVTEHRGRERRRPVRVDRADDHVRGHDAGDPRLDGRAERLELTGVEHVRLGVHARQRVVRVGHRVAVPGEVLGARGDAGRLDALDVGRGVAGHVGRLGAEAARPDDGVLVGGVHVDHRCEVEVDAVCRQLASDGRRRGSRQRGVVEPPEQRVAGLGRARRVVQAGDVAALLVDGDDEARGGGPQRRAQLRQLVGVDDVRTVEADGGQPRGILPRHPRGDGGADETGHERAEDEAPQRLS